MRQRYGAPYWVVHRADLQRILLDAVRSQPAIRLMMGRSVEEVTEGPESASVTFVTGQRRARDPHARRGHRRGRSLVEGAEQSRRDPAPRLSRRHRVARHPRAGESPAELALNRTGLWLGPRGHVVHYPIAGGTLINIVAIERNPEPVEGWAAPGDRQLLLAQYAKAAAPLRALLAEPAEWLRWSLFDRPAGRIAQGRVALLGDAAHPVLPFLAQGAALAIEDAATLASLLPTDPAQVPTRAEDLCGNTAKAASRGSRTRLAANGQDLPCLGCHGARAQPRDAPARSRADDEPV